MKLSNFPIDRSINLEDKKRGLQRKEAGDAYRKNSLYFQPQKNSALSELEDLLSGSKEQALYDEQKKKEENPEAKAAVRELQQIDQNVRAHEQAHMAAGGNIAEGASYIFTEGPDGKRYITGGEVSINTPSTSNSEETIAILEQVKRAALAPADPSPQDLRVAASATIQIQQAQTQENDEQSPSAFVNEEIEASVPERFTKDVERDAQQETFFSKTATELNLEKRFNYAKERYTAHSEMVKNGYGVEVQPTFSLIA